MTSQTSILSYYEELPRLPAKQALVLDALRRLGRAATDAELSTTTQLPRSLVAARRRELVLAGLVLAAGEKQDPLTRKTVTTWRMR